MLMRNTLAATGLGLALAGTMALAHGDVAPQPVDTEGLPEVGEEWLIENPYRMTEVSEDVWLRALEIGSSGYNQNCARCHGLEVVSGGIAPDLRYLEAEEYGDEWFVERFRHGYTQNGTTKMPAFGELLGQEAAWAIRTYIEARPDGDDMEAASSELKEIRDTLKAGGGDIGALSARLREIAVGIGTLSGAPVADSVAYRAANLLERDPGKTDKAAEILTIGLSVAQ